jgi:acyl carrier protein
MAVVHHPEVRIMVFETIKKIIAEQLSLSDPSKITMETSLIKDLEADSLDAVEIVLAIEEEYDIEIPDEVAETFTLVADLVKYVEEEI